MRKLFKIQKPSTLIHQTMSFPFGVSTPIFTRQWVGKNLHIFSLCSRVELVYYLMLINNLFISPLLPPLICHFLCFVLFGEGTIKTNKFLKKTNSYITFFLKRHMWQNFVYNKKNICTIEIIIIFFLRNEELRAIITSTSAHWSIDFDIGIPMRMEIHDLNDKVLIDFLRPLTPPPMNDPWSYI